MQKTLQRNKNMVYPRDPKTFENIRNRFKERNILDAYGYDMDDESRFYIDTVIASDYAFTIFASMYVINYIKEHIPPGARQYLMDGTFDSLPAGFYQFLTISIEHHNDVSVSNFDSSEFSVRPLVFEKILFEQNRIKTRCIYLDFLSDFQIFPAVFCLMTRKTAKSYLAVFRFIEQNLFKLEPAEVMTDYEDGMRLAIRTQWPNVIIRGCWFHYVRAILRRCRKLGMVQLLKKNSNARVIQKNLMSLPLLPSVQIEEGYCFIKKFAQKKKLLSRFTLLFDYMEDYWFRQVRFHLHLHYTI